ncbi:MAG: hypothetical protein KF796_12200 [Ramlibacter sp.]|nr:hypothetical protein [Ramlibacter sp.]
MSRAWARTALWCMGCLLAAGCTTLSQEARDYIQTCDHRLQPQPLCLVQPTPQARTLKAGEGARAMVDARCLWNRTGVLLEPGARYVVSAGPARDWRDKGIESDLASGWTGTMASALERLARLFARDSHSPMYSLVGARGKEAADYVLIGHGRTIEGTGQATVELQAFANDWRAMYGNNHGCVELTILREK